MGDLRETIVTRGRGVVVGNVFLRRPNTTASDEILFRREYNRGRGSVYRDPNLVDKLDFPVTTTASLGASKARSWGDRRLAVSTGLLDLLGTLVSEGVTFYHEGDRPREICDPILLRGETSPRNPG